eukprot:5242946-Amphidinium_carterae.1
MTYRSKHDPKYDPKCNAKNCIDDMRGTSPPELGLYSMTQNYDPKDDPTSWPKVMTQSITPKYEPRDDPMYDPQHDPKLLQIMTQNMQTQLIASAIRQCKTVLQALCCKHA